MFINLTPFKLFENKQKALSILRKFHIPEDDKRYQSLKELLKDNPGYLGKFTEWYFVERISIDRLKELLDLLNKVRIDKSIDEFKTYENAFDYVQNFEINTKVNQVLKALPSGTRQLVNDELKQLILLNTQYSKNIIDFYSKKGGRYKDIRSLISDTKSLIKNLSGDFNLGAMLRKIEDAGLFEKNPKTKLPSVEIKLKTPELLIIQVNDYKASCVIGSKHWCISTSESMWGSYVNSFTNQYFIYDFTKDVSDKRHLIGVTVSPDGSFSAAHWADDTGVQDKNYFNEL